MSVLDLPPSNPIANDVRRRQRIEARLARELEMGRRVLAEILRGPLSDGQGERLVGHFVKLAADHESPRSAEGANRILGRAGLRVLNRGLGYLLAVGNAGRLVKQLYNGTPWAHQFRQQPLWYRSLLALPGAEQTPSTIMFGPPENHPNGTPVIGREQRAVLIPMDQVL